MKTSARSRSLSSFTAAVPAIGRRLPGLIAMAAALASTVHAADVTWDGGLAGTSGTWLNVTNWNPDGVPIASDTAIFSSAGTATEVTIQMATALGVQQVGALKLDTGNTISRTIRNNSGTSNGVLVLNGISGTLIRNESAARLRLTNGVGTAMQIGLAASGEIYAANDPSTTIFSVDVFSSITNYGSANGFTKTGPGTLYLRSVNTFTGPVTNSNGIIKLNDTGTIGNGSGTLYMNGGYLVAANSRLSSPVWNPIVLLADANIYPDSGQAGITNQRYFPLGGAITGGTGSVVIGNQSTTSDNYFVVRLLAGGYTLSRPLTLGSIADTSGTFKVLEFANGPTNGVLTVDSLISGDASAIVRREGDANGLTLLTAANTYGGGTQVRSGNLFANNTTGSALGTGAVTVTNAGTLGGTGSISGTANVIGSGTLSPGSTTNNIGNLTFTTDLTLSPAAKYTVHINAATGTPGVNWDVVTVNGTWTDAATSIDPVIVKLDSLGAIPTGWNSGIGRTWKIIDGGTASGFDATHFALDTTAFAGAVQGVFSFSVVSGDLFLTYTPAADLVINVASGSVNQGGTSPTPYPLLTGTFGVLKVGNGEVVFTNAANDYAGSTKIYAGTGSISVDALNGSGALGAASSAIQLGNTLGTSNATLNISVAGVTNARNITVQSGSTGTKTIATSVTGGTAYYLGDIALQDDVTLSAPAGGTAAFAGIISGTNTVTKTNAGTVSLAGISTYTGKTRILAGKLSVDGINRLGAAPAGPVADQLTIDGSTLEYTGGTVTSVANRGVTLGAGGATFALNGGSGILSWEGAFTGPGALIKVGTNRIDLNHGTNTYAGDTFLYEGEIGLDADGLPGTGTLRLAGGSLGLANSRSTTNTASFIANPVVVSSNSIIRTTGGLSGTSRIAVFSGSWTGTGGTLTLLNGGTTITNSTADLRQLGGGFDFTRPLVLDNGIGTNNFVRLYLGNPASAGTQTFSGVISGNGRIRRTMQDTNSAAGVSILTAANTYSGGTEVGAGTLLVNNTTGSGTGSGDVSVETGATLGGTGILSGGVNVSGVLAPGTTGAGTLTLGGGLNLATNGTFLWELTALATNSPGVNFDSVTLLSGNLELAGTSTLQLVFTNAATNPDGGNPFWNTSRKWTVASITGAASNPGLTAFATLSNATFTAGYFTNYADAGGNVILEYVSTAPVIPPQPVISSSITGAGTANATISFSSTNGASYTIQAKTNLTQPTWDVLGSLTASGPTTTFTDTNGPFRQRFFRVISP